MPSSPRSLTSARGPALALVMLGLGAPLALGLFQHFGLHVRFLAKSAPSWSQAEALRVLVCALSAACLVAAIGLLAGGRAAALRPDHDSAFDDSAALRWGPALLSASAAAFALLLIGWPKTFNYHTFEHSPVEWFSAAAPLLACGFALAAARRLTGRAGQGGFSVLLCGFALCCFLIAGEEVSWGYHFHKVTPAMFEGNAQRETNLHNFHATLFEYAYYLGVSFVALVLLPTLRWLGLVPAAWRWIEPTIPSTRFIGPGAVICAVNYDMLMGVPTLVAFWTAAFVLAARLLWCPAPEQRWSAAGYLLAMFALQGIFASHGASYARVWELNEYKEFLIALALLLWSVLMWRRAGGARERPWAPASSDSRR